jgi:hypothetical protein
MRHVRAVCDRCSSPIVERGSILELTAGSLRGRLPEPLELCHSCADLLVDFIASGRQTNQDDTGAIPGHWGDQTVRGSRAFLAAGGRVLRGAGGCGWR